jgi:hypothetical protein
MLSLFSHLRNRNKKEMERKVADMAPEKRSELTEQIMKSGITDESMKEDMADIERDLEHAVDTLHKAEESEQFVGLRFHKYQDMLRARAKELVEAEEEEEKEETDDETTEEMSKIVANDDDDNEEQADDAVATNDDNDEEAGLAKQLTPEERLVQVQKLQRDEAALFKVEQHYKTLQQTTRALKKKVFTLERRRDVLLRHAIECEEFVIAAAVADGQAGFIVDEEDMVEDDGPQRATWALESDMNNLNVNDGSSDDDLDSDGDSSSDNVEIDTRVQHKLKKAKDSNVGDDTGAATGGSESAE